MGKLQLELFLCCIWSNGEVRKVVCHIYPRAGECNIITKQIKRQFKLKLIVTPYLRAMKFMTGGGRYE